MLTMVNFGYNCYCMEHTHLEILETLKLIIIETMCVMDDLQIVRLAGFGLWCLMSLSTIFQFDHVL